MLHPCLKLLIHAFWRHRAYACILLLLLSLHGLPYLIQFKLWQCLLFDDSRDRAYTTILGLFAAYQITVGLAYLVKHYRIQGMGAYEQDVRLWAFEKIMQRSWHNFMLKSSLQWAQFIENFVSDGISIAIQIMECMALVMSLWVILWMIHSLILILIYFCLAIILLCHKPSNFCRLRYTKRYQNSCHQWFKSCADFLSQRLILSSSSQHTWAKSMMKPKAQLLSKHAILRLQAIDTEHSATMRFNLGLQVFGMAFCIMIYRLKIIGMGDAVTAIICGQHLLMLCRHIVDIKADMMSRYQSYKSSHDLLISSNFVDVDQDNGSEIQSIELVMMRFAYDDQILLRTDALSIKPGNHVAIIGSSGCGKSTLLKLLAGLDQPNEGIIQTCLPSQMVYLPQDAKLFRMPLVEQLQLYGTLSMSDIHRLLTAVGMQDHVDIYNQFCTSQHFSAGQSKRLLLARLLTCSYPFIFCDEPTAGLDQQASCHMMALLRRYMAKQTIVVVTHDRRAAEQFDRLWEIKNGRIIELR